ncbi:MAG TPA: hypothetical protein VM492_07970 [Sumerlaeia bacterium]|nr:hypothetical protein [Sumerlaeia bacterium]
MLRYVPLFTLFLALGAFLAMSCGETSPEVKIDPRQERTQRLRANVDRLQEKTADLQLQSAAMSEQVRTNEVDLSRRLEEMKQSIAAVEREMVEIRALIEESIPAEAKQPPEKKAHGWPWFIKLILILALVVGALLLLRRLARDEEEEFDEELLDDEFLEENDLGAIRYPAGTGRGEKNGSPSEN